MEDTVQELGEGRGMPAQYIAYHSIPRTPTNHRRHLRSRLCREKGRETQGGIRLRCPSHSCLGSPLDFPIVNIPDTPTISIKRQNALLSLRPYISSAFSDVASHVHPDYRQLYAFNFSFSKLWALSLAFCFSSLTSSGSDIWML